MSKETKLNLSETLKKYNLLSEYNFYIPRKDDNDGMYKGEDDTLDEQDIPTEEVPAAELPTEEVPTTDVMPIEDITSDVSVTEPTPTTSPEASSEGEVEIDVTDIVKDTRETKQAVASGNEKVDELLSKLGDLEYKLAAMNDLVNKIEELETEIEKRNPTPEEKLEMRSLDSYPYNLKLTDYWADKEGAYNVMGNNNKNVVSLNKNAQPEEKEYVLTQGEVENDYNEGEISDSFYPEN